MKKYRLAIYTNPEAKEIYKEDVDQIGQGLILAKDCGHTLWKQCKELRCIQWHVILNEGFTANDGIKLVVGRYTPIGELVIKIIARS